MKRLVIAATLISIVFSGCATKQMIEDSNQDKKKLKKAIVKLIKENKEITQEISIQSMDIEELNLQVQVLKKEIQELNKDIQKQKYRVDNYSKKEQPKVKKKQKPLVKLWQKGSSQTFLIEVIKHKANLRVLPEPDAQIVSVASVGDEFSVMDKSSGENRWYQVLYKNEPLWIYSESVRVLGK